MGTQRAGWRANGAIETRDLNGGAELDQVHRGRLLPAAGTVLVDGRTFHSTFAVTVLLHEFTNVSVGAVHNLLAFNRWVKRPSRVLISEFQNLLLEDALAGFRTCFSEMR